MIQDGLLPELNERIQGILKYLTIQLQQGQLEKRQIMEVRKV